MGGAGAERRVPRAAGLGVAAVTGWLRIAADKHYATDVALGAGLGAGVGVAVPLLLHAPTPLQWNSTLSPWVSPNVGGLTLTGAF